MASDQLRSMLWKNWLLKIRHPLATILEVILPSTIMIMLMLIRTRVDFHSHPPAAYIKRGTFVEVGKSDISPSFDTFLRLWAATGEHIAFVPESNETNAMIDILSIKFPLLQIVSKTYKDEQLLESYIKSKNYASYDPERNISLPKIKAAVIFRQQGPCCYDYSIRLNHSWAFQGFPDITTIMDTTGPYLDDLELGVNTLSTLEYGYSGFLTLQQVLDSYIILVAQQRPQNCSSDQRTSNDWNFEGKEFFMDVNKSLNAYTPKSINIAPFPTREYTDDEFQSIVKSVLGILYLLAFLYPVSRLISCLVLEKEKGIKGAMRMIGLHDFNFYLSWFITYTLQFALSSIIICVVSSNTIFKYSSKSVVFVYFFTFGLSAITMSFLITTFFTRAKTATAVGTLSFLAAFFPYYVVVDTGIPMYIKLIASLFSPTAFALGTVNFADYERAHVGVRWSNIWKQSSGVVFLLCLVMMVVDACLYALAAWYFSQVLEDGCKRSVCYGIWEFARNMMKKPLEVIDIEDHTAVPSSMVAAIEHVSMDFRQQELDERCIQIKNLRKVFETGGRRFVAVESLDLTLYEGQILALLGHNGAGKSTTIGMLIGLIPPTSGDVFVLGKSIRTDMAYIRKHLGVCSQNDVLFPELTVREHLMLFGNVKSVPGNALRAEVDTLVNEVGLSDKENTLVCQLSGGMKRKLSVAIAFLGDSKVVILDEPTSGMDPYSMRSTWRILKRYKKGRIILLTTHSMDEADILGDRIAILGDGVLRCCGSSLFLKHRYGVGYTLTLVKRESGIEAICETVKRHVPSATLLSDVGSELSFRLPLVATAAFKSLFEELETHMAREGTLHNLENETEEISEESTFEIESYGISVTTLEEVFLRVSRGALGETSSVSNQVRSIGKETEVDISEEKDMIECDDSGSDTMGTRRQDNRFQSANRGRYSMVSGCVSLITGILTNMVSVFKRYPILHLGRKKRSLFGRHFRALFMKRALSARRDKKTIAFQLLVPSFFLFLGLLLLIIKAHPDQPSVTLTTEFFNPLVRGDGGGGPIPFNLSLPIAKKVAHYVTGGWIQKQTFRSYRFPDPDSVLADAVGVAGPVNGPALVAMSEYLITSLNESYQSRYGAVVMEDRYSDGSLGYTVLHNSTCQHGAATYINVMNNAILSLATGNSSITIKTRNYPLPMTQSQVSQRRDLNAFSAGIIVNIAYSFIPASFAVAIVKEREVKAKHQQLISGVSLMAYWVSTYVWDVISYLLPASLAVGLFLAFGMEEFIGKESLLATTIMMVAYGPAIASSTYCLTFFFTDHSTAQNAILLIHFFGGLILMVSSFIMGLVRATKHVNNVLKNIFRLSPGFCLADGLASLALRRQSLKPSSVDEPFAWNTTGASITYLLCEGIVYFIIVLAMELLPAPYVLLSWLKNCFWNWKMQWRTPIVGTITEPLLHGVMEDEDEDVSRERHRVLSTGAKESLVRLINLRKVYAGDVRQPPKVAVESLSFAIDAGECFGFLGVNGAGKTTTLSMLCGELPSTEGRSYIVGHDISINPTDARHFIGYCPQFDALLDLLTVREHLELYANIKAVPEDKVNQVVEEKLSEFDLWAHANKIAASLSGGNKRKLSVAIAMIGDPPIVILDEPSTGMDPVAKRFMWDVITRISTRRGLSAVILTTHSMAEAQALCTRIGIMAAGRLRCIGSPQHLKSRFGNSLELEVKALPASVTEIDKLCGTLLRTLPSLMSWKRDDGGGGGGGLVLCQSDIRDAAYILGNEKWGEILLYANHGSTSDGVLGELVAHELADDGKVEMRVFCEWWVSKYRATIIDSFVRSSFCGATLLEINGYNFRYQLPYGSSSLACVFGELEQHRSELGISEYSVGQATLEAIFNGFAAHQ